MKIVCFGDSNTYGYDPRSYFGGRYSADNRWVDILAAKTDWELINMGQNGLAIAEAEFYGQVLSKSDVDLIIIMLGSNDLLQGLSAKAVTARMGRFLSGITNAKEKILLVSPPHFKAGLWVPDDITLEHSSQLGSFYQQLANKLGIDFVDAGSWDIPLCHDGVHFTEKGHRIFADNILKHILKDKEI